VIGIGYHRYIYIYICYKWACVVLLGCIDLQNNCYGIKVFNTKYVVSKVNA
jgi:hypothetical protein